MKNVKALFISMILLTMTAAVLFINGCNTWHGAGQDVERAGEKMQDN